MSQHINQKPTPEVLFHANWDSHVVLEASAGTGKTYTLEAVAKYLVTGKLKGLKDRKPLEPGQLIIATYTKKAAQEIMHRLEDSLEGAANIWVGTIHSLCERMIKEFGGGGYPSNAQLIEKEATCSQNLRKLWYTHFKSLYENSFLKKESENQDKKLKLQEILKNLVHSSGYISPGSPFQIYPKISQSAVHSLERKFRESGNCCQNLLKELLNHVKDLEPPHDAKKSKNKQVITPSSQSIYKLGLALDFPAPKKIKDNWYTWAIDALLVSPPDGPLNFPELLFKFSTKNKYSGDPAIYIDKILNSLDFPSPQERILYWFNKLGQKGITLLEALEEFLILTVLLIKQYSSVHLLPHIDYFESFLTHLSQESQHYRESQGLYCHEDILDYTLRESLNQSSPLTQAIRRKFKYCLIDEFQDTSPKQWEIFRNFFLSSQADCKLWLIGDPKQSIYSFQGSDLDSYFLATQNILSAGGQKLPLTTNYRSVPVLVDWVNTLLNQNDFFHDPRIETYRVKAGKHPSESYLSSPSEPEGLFLYRDTEIESSKGDTTKILAQLVAQLHTNKKIKRLDECAILVQTHTQANEMQNALQKLGLPAHHYQGRGLYQSREALHILIFLEALAFPDDLRCLQNATLTIFSGHPAHNLDHLLKKKSQPSSLLEYAQNFAQKSDFERLFVFMYQTALRFAESYKDANLNSDLLHCSEEPNFPDFSILESLFFNLLGYSQTHTSELVDFVNFLRLKKDKLDRETGETGSDLFPAQISNALQIMTIHASKGLEFKHVFLGYTSHRKKNDYPLFLRSTYFQEPTLGIIKWVDFGFLSLISQKNTAENARLDYVALTRAADCLYIPYPEMPPQGELPWITQLRKILNYPQTLPFELITVESLDYSIKQEGALYKNINFDTPPELTITSPRNTNWTLYTSYTQIAKQQSKYIRLKEDEKALEQNSSIFPAHQLLARTDQPAPLTAIKGGQTAGIKMHALLENFPVELLESKLIEFENLLTHPLWLSYLPPRVPPSWLNGQALIDLTQYFSQLLQTQLPLDEESVPLFKIIKNEGLREPRFIVNTRPGLHLTGALDFVFRWKNKYSFLDLKTNTLADYSLASLSPYMEEHNYTLQLKIYTLALHNFLKTHLAGYTPENNLGGAGFLFIRGLQKGTQNGIYWKNLAESDLEINLNKELIPLLEKQYFDALNKPFQILQNQNELLTAKVLELYN